MRDRTGWPSLLEWSLALGLIAFAVISVMSIGVFVLPFGVMALAIAARRNRAWPESLSGGLVGAGGVCLVVAYRNRAYSPCPPLGTPMRLSFGEHFTCGGFDPTPWLAIGLLMTGAGLVSYLAFRRIRGAAAT